LLLLPVQFGGAGFDLLLSHADLRAQCLHRLRNGLVRHVQFVAEFFVRGFERLLFLLQTLHPAAQAEQQEKRYDNIDCGDSEQHVAQRSVAFRRLLRR
jgi:hypothetical protein